MNILALDTSMGACSAAVLLAAGSERTLFARQATMARGHAEALMPMVAEVMAKAGISFGALDMIAATTGPGSFTGVRIAISAARGLALVTKAKLFGTDTLTVMARIARADDAFAEAPFAVAVDARRGMIYFGLYDSEGHRLEGPRLLTPDDAASLLPAGLRSTVGSGGALLADAASARGLSVAPKRADLQPSAEALAFIACESGKATPALRPLYLRAPDAKPQENAVAARR